MTVHHAPGGDRRLDSIDAHLRQGRAKVLSVDVFDTLLWRRVPEPHDVFLVLGRNLKRDGRLASHISALQFAELRRAAELRARARREAETGSREIFLADIYREMPDGLFDNRFLPADRVEFEISLERRLLCADHEVVAVMSRAKAAGVKVILVSDTYFRAAEIVDFLCSAGVAAPIDRVVVSCEAGRPKWRDLFPHLLKELGVAPSEVLHFGDTIEADIAPCQRAGIPAVHYDKWAFADRAREFELPKAWADRIEAVGDGGDAGITGLRSRLFHRCPASVNRGQEIFWRYGASTLAPALAAFARWVVRSAEAAGVTRIYGLMREGRFLKRLIEASARRAGITLTVEELWLSRRAVIRAAFAPDAADLLTEFVLLTPGRTTGDILANMGLSSADLAAADPALAGFDINRPDALQRLCAAIGAHQPLQIKVYAHAARLKRALLTGLGKAIDFSDAKPVILVDLGYMATIQSVLARLLSKEAGARPLVGLYFALNDNAAGNVLAGVDARSFLADDGFSGPTAAILTRTPDVLEHACMCDEGSLSHYDDHGVPVLLPNQRDRKQLDEMAVLQDGILAGASAYDSVVLADADSPALRRQLGRMVEVAMLHPTTDEARAMGTWKHEAKVDAMPALALNDAAIDPASIEYGGWAALQAAGRDQLYWPAAAFGRLGLSDVYAAGVEGAYTARHLDSGHLLGRIAICPDVGIGFDGRREGAVELRTNSFGRGQITVSLKTEGPDAYVRLRLTWPKSRALVTLDRIIATYIVDGRPSAVQVVASEWTGACDLGGGERLIEGGATVIDLGAVTPPKTHALDLELRFKYLRLDPLFAKN